MSNIERSPSIRSLKQTIGSDSGVFSARSFGEVERLVFMQRRPADVQSDTSSQQERKFANLLGGDDRDTGEEQHFTPAKGSVGHRLYYTGCDKERQRQEALRQEREKVMMKEMTELTQRPAITQRAREKPAKGTLFADHASEWRKKRDDKLEQKAREERDREEAEITGEPLLNAHSLAILEDSGRYKDPVGGWEQHYAKYCAKHAHPVSKAMFNPNINANAVRADADIPIHERLYGDSEFRRSRLREAANERLEQELRDPATGRPFFSPQSLRPPASRTGSMHRAESDRSVFDQLHEVGRRRDTPTAQADPEATFAPKINPKSSELAEKVRKPLYTPGRQSRPSETNSPTNSQAESQGGKLSPKLSKRNLDEFFRRNERSDHLRQSRLEQVKRDLENRSAQDCSFQPRINDHSVAIFEAAHVYGKPMGSPTADGVAFTSDNMYNYAPGTGSGGPSFDQKTSPMAAPATTRKVSDLSPRPTSNLNIKPLALGRGDSLRAGSSRSLHQSSNFGGGGTSDSPGVVHGASRPPPQPQAQGQGQGQGQGDDYLSTFEKQMFAVLDEWRRLEEV